MLSFAFFDACRWMAEPAGNAISWNNPLSISCCLHAEFSVFFLKNVSFSISAC